MWRGLFGRGDEADFDLELKFVEAGKIRKSSWGEVEDHFICKVIVRDTFPHHTWLGEVEQALKETPEKHPALITKKAGSDKAIISIDLASFIVLLEEAGYKLEKIEDKEDSKERR